MYKEYNFKCLNKETEFNISSGVLLGDDIVFGPNCKLISIGFGSFLGDDLYIDVPELYIGDYTTIHRGGTIHGYLPCRIGHNCWIGQFAIIDSIGGISIGNNVGIGAHSQLWSHIKFGDTLEGCKWNKASGLKIEDDVWFVGHCIVSPIHACKKSMLMVGGVITMDMEENHVYAGVPAKDITSKVGKQFEIISIEEKQEMFNKHYQNFLVINNLTKSDYQILVVDKINKDRIPKETVFNLKDRTYLPTRTELEYKFMKYLLYDKAKFIPIEI